jgi:hypothetical protein
MLALDLVLLGFPNPIRPNVQLFLRPNSKLLEEVLYFLYEKLDGDEALERFKDSWPIGNALTAKKFRADVLKWSEDLKRNGMIPRECALRKSWLDEPVGERLEGALSRLAEFLVERKANEIDVSCPENISAIGHAMEESVGDSEWNQLVEIKGKFEKIDLENKASIELTPRSFAIPKLPEIPPVNLIKFLA